MFLYLRLEGNMTLHRMEFESRSWADHLYLLTKGTQVTVLGKIKEIGAFRLELTNCELVETK